MSNAVDELLLDGPDEVSALLLALANKSLLVPLSAVAEVTNNDMTITPMENPDDRFYGWITWRDQPLPLLSFEGLSGETPLPLTTQSRVVILNAIGAAAERGFYGLVVQGYPQRVNVVDSDEGLVEKSKDIPGVLYEVVEGELALIPDFEYLERLSIEIPSPD
jgi:chemosensory pili system protein ChpC